MVRGLLLMNLQHQKRRDEIRSKQSVKIAHTVASSDELPKTVTILLDESEI